MTREVAVRFVKAPPLPVEMYPAKPLPERVAYALDNLDGCVGKIRDYKVGRKSAADALAEIAGPLAVYVQQLREDLREVVNRP
jgi:hypothetical protein